MMVIVPDSLHNAINEKLNAQFLIVPDAEQYREHLYNEVLQYFNDNGTLPDFTLERK